MAPQDKIFVISSISRLNYYDLVNRLAQIDQLCDHKSTVHPWQQVQCVTSSRQQENQYCQGTVKALWSDAANHHGLYYTALRLLPRASSQFYQWIIVNLSTNTLQYTLQQLQKIVNYSMCQSQKTQARVFMQPNNVKTCIAIQYFQYVTHNYVKGVMYWVHMFH